MVKENKSTTATTSRSKKAVGQPDKLTCIEEIHDSIEKTRAEIAGYTAEITARKAYLKTLEKRRDTLVKLGPAALKEQQPLFQGKDEKPTAAKKPKADKPAKAATGDAKAWRSLPVKDAISLGVVVNQLEVWEQPVRNLGELALFLKKRKFQDLPGVSADKAGEAIDQYENFFKAHPEYER